MTVLASLGVTIDASGCTSPAFADVLETLQFRFRSIFGSDVLLDPDTLDGQWLGAMADAINDANMAAVAAYNARSPKSAQGVALDAVVKINGIARKDASRSTAPLLITGVAGTILNNAYATDAAGNVWDIPSGTTIGLGGTTTATGTARNEGSVQAAISTIIGIGTPTLGWQAVTNTAAADIGAAVETDAALRRRQSLSVAFPSQSIIDGVRAAVANVAGVNRSWVYENDTDSTDPDGIPAHSISSVTEGGDINAIADAIFLRKSPGIQTYGDQDVTVYDSRGIPSVIHLYEVTQVDLKVEVNVTALSGWSAASVDLIRSAVEEFIAEMNIGEDSYLLALAAPAQLSGEAAVLGTGMSQELLAPLARTFHLTSLRQAKDAGALAASDIAIDFNEAAICSDPATRITINVS